MQLIVQGKGLEVTDWLRQYVEKKLGKLDRYLASITEIRVELSAQNTKSANDRQVAQVTMRSNGVILRAEERSDDIFASIDSVVDKMYRQVSRFKGKKRERRSRGFVSTAEQAPLSAGSALEEGEIEFDEADDEEREEGESVAIVRVKRFIVRPMAPDEAIEQMELVGHDFFLFMNSESDALNVVYRRKDGNYGLLQPELA